MAKGYVDGFVLPVRADKLDVYLELAQASTALWLKHGALSVVEAVGEDAPRGKRTSYPQAVDLAIDEVLVYATLTYRSRKHRDEVNASVSRDPEMAAMMAKMPIAADRMIWGGFEVEISETAKPAAASRRKKG